MPCSLWSVFSWLDLRLPDGTRRLDDPSDFVRLEIATALKDGLPMIPVLVGGAKMPGEEALLDVLRPFGRSNAVALAAGRFEADLEHLVEAVDHLERRELWTRREVVIDLPAAVSEFVGREEERQALRAAVEGGERLVTVIGPGGTGKTRLAVEVAHDLAPSFPDGVHFVDLAPLTDPTLIPSAIAGALNVREVAGEPLLATLKNWLRDRTTLLLLDNMEQLGDDLAVLEGLLSVSPHLVILVTSRSALASGGEPGDPAPAGVLKRYRADPR